MYYFSTFKNFTLAQRLWTWKILQIVTYCNQCVHGYQAEHSGYFLSTQEFHNVIIHSTTKLSMHSAVYCNLQHKLADQVVQEHIGCNARNWQLSGFCMRMHGYMFWIIIGKASIIWKYELPLTCKVAVQSAWSHCISSWRRATNHILHGLS